MRRAPWIPILIISVMLVMAVFAPVLAPYDPIDQTLKDKLLPPQQMRAPIVWLMSDASSKHTGERYSAKDWPKHLSDEAAARLARSPHQEVPHIM